MPISEIQSDTKVVLTIHRLEILRNEIKMYKYFADEKHKTINDYSMALTSFNNQIEEIDTELSKMRSPGTGGGNGGPSAPLSSDIKYNALIAKKERIAIKKEEWLSKNNDDYFTNIAWLDARKATVEHYLDKLNEGDRKFIMDLYVKSTKFKKVMEVYKIKNDGDAFRKATNILKKIL